MHLELQLSNDPRAMPSVRAFVSETLGHLPLRVDVAAGIGTIVVAAVEDAIACAYPPGEDGAVRVAIDESHGKLEIQVRDFGGPQDVSKLERKLHEQSALLAAGVDEMHWLSFGPDGKALQVVKWLHETHIADSSPDAPPFRDDAPLAPQQQYTIEPLQPGDAIQVSQLMYRAYGNTYFNRDVYYPQRVAALNANGSLVSYVAKDQAGIVVGHLALELDPGGRVAESGQAVVDPAHRGRGLLDRLKNGLLAEGSRRNLLGWYADAVAVHTLTQQSNAHHGGHLCAVELGISPKTERFRGFDQEQPQRVTCIMYFHWLSTPSPRTVCAPPRHHAMLAAIYKNLGCEVHFDSESPAQGHGTLAVKFEPGAARAMLRVDQVGTDSAHAVVHARRELIERSGAAVVFVDLPISAAGCAALVESLEAAGFGFTGVAPCALSNGDALRMAYLVEPLAREPIKTFEPFADELTNYALAEQQRVRQPL